MGVDEKYLELFVKEEKLIAIKTMLKQKKRHDIWDSVDGMMTFIMGNVLFVIFSIFLIFGFPPNNTISIKWDTVKSVTINIIWLWIIISWIAIVLFCLIRIEISLISYIEYKFYETKYRENYDPLIMNLTHDMYLAGIDYQKCFVKIPCSNEVNKG